MGAWNARRSHAPWRSQFRAFRLPELAEARSQRFLAVALVRGDWKRNRL
jgi:hypothetical protein